MRTYLQIKFLIFDSVKVHAHFRFSIILCNLLFSHIVKNYIDYVFFFWQSFRLILHEALPFDDPNVNCAYFNERVKSKGE